MTSGYVFSFIIPLILSILITPWVIKFALQIGAVDEPGKRKIHDSITPQLGGLVIITSIASTLLILFLFNPGLLGEISEHTSQAIVLGLCFFAIFLLGLWDDLMPLNLGIKFGVQFTVAAIVYYAGFQISDVINLFGVGMLDVEMINFPLTLLWIVGITNAFNLIDGLDGLASGVATIACISIFVVSVWAGETWTATLALVLAGALTGFLRYNFSPAKIFLGDSGSLMIGFVLAIISIQSATKMSTGFALVFPVLILGLPITDTIISMLRRFLGSYLPAENPDDLKDSLQNIFKPDQSHIHHRLISLGLTHRNTVLLLYIVSAFFALAGVTVTQMDTFEQSAGIVFICALAFFLGIKKLRYREIAIFNNGLMLQIYKRLKLNKGIFLSLIDFGSIVGSFILSYSLIHSINTTASNFSDFNQTLVMVLSLQLFAFWISGLYKKPLQLFGIENAVKITASVAYAVAFTAVALLITNAFSFVSVIHFSVLDFYFLLTFILGIRISYQVLIYWFQEDKNPVENVLIYGANENGTMILHQLNNSANHHFNVVGFVDENADLEGKQIYGYPIFSGNDKLTQTMENASINHIFICEGDIKIKNLNRIEELANLNEIKIIHLSTTDLKNISTTPYKRYFVDK